MLSDRIRASQFDGGYSAEFLPVGERSWRIVRSGGKPIPFASRRAALAAAENALIQRMEPTIRATIQRSPEEAEARMEAIMADEAENWLRSKRSDVKGRDVRYEAGRRPLVVLRGRAAG